MPGTLQLTTLAADRARVVEVCPLCKAGDSSHLRTARLSPRWRTDSCTLARQQQFTFPRMAGGRLLRRAGG
jgi:transposase-like protein